MNSYSIYLLSGANSVSTGAAFPCVGIKDFTVQTYSEGGIPAVGTVNLECQLDSSAPWATLAVTSTVSATGGVNQYRGPFEKLRASVNPFTSGQFTVLVRYSNKY